VTSLAGQTSVRLNMDWRLSTDQNSARSAELPRCSTSRLECPPCLDLRSTSISRGQFRAGCKPISSIEPTTSSENILFNSILYLLTYLLTLCEAIVTKFGTLKVYCKKRNSASILSAISLRAAQDYSILYEKWLYLDSVHVAWRCGRHCNGQSRLFWPVAF